MEQPNLRPGFHIAGWTSTAGWPEGGVTDEEICKHKDWNEALEIAMNAVAANPAGSVAEITHYFARGWKVKIWTFQIGKAVTYASPSGQRRLVWHDSCVQRPPGEDGGMMGGGMMGGGMMGGGMWNPNAICDGKRAEERAVWLQQNQGLAPMVAQQQIMREFPTQFGGGMGGGMMGGGMIGGGMWNPNAICDGKRAEERALWLQQNQGLAPMAAEQQVMREFPAQFGGGMQGGGMMGPGCAPAMGGGMWNPNAICDGKRAEERAVWLQQNQGLAPMVAQQQIMREFPAQFGGGMMGGGMWSPNALCDGKRAEERAMWLQQNQGLAPMAAQQQVMREFPAQFGMM